MSHASEAAFLSSLHSAEGFSGEAITSQTSAMQLSDTNYPEVTEQINLPEVVDVTNYSMLATFTEEKFINNIA